MDPQTRIDLHPIHRFDLNEEPLLSADFAKKRKLPYEDVVLPPAKYKSRDRFHECDDDSSIEDVIDLDKSVSLENSGGWNRSAMNREAYFEMTLDTRSREAGSLDCKLHSDQPSSSSGSCITNMFRNPADLDASSQNTYPSAKDMIDPEEEDGSCFEDELAPYKEQLYEIEAFSDLLSSEIEANVLKKCLGAETDGLFLCSSGLTTDPFAQTLDKKPAVQKPTIDREFEQYFSSLML